MPVAIAQYKAFGDRSAGHRSTALDGVRFLRSRASAVTCMDRPRHRHRPYGEGACHSPAKPQLLRRTAGTRVPQVLILRVSSPGPPGPRLDDEVVASLLLLAPS